MFSPHQKNAFCEFCGILTYILRISQLYIFLTDCHLDKIMGKNRSQGQKWNLLQLCYASMMIRSVVWRKQRTWQRNVPRAHLLFILRLMFNVGFVYACFFHAYNRLSDWIVIVLFFNPTDREYSWRWKVSPTERMVIVMMFGVTTTVNRDNPNQTFCRMCTYTHTHTRLLNTGSEYSLLCIDLPLHRLADLQNCFVFVWSGYSNVIDVKCGWIILLYWCELTHLIRQKHVLMVSLIWG